jgi:hypothetical protein
MVGLGEGEEKTQCSGDQVGVDAQTLNKVGIWSGRGDLNP